MHKAETRKVKDLIPYARNSRTHSDEQVTHIASTMSGDWAFCLENDCYTVNSLGEVFRVCRRQTNKAGELIEKYETVKLKGSLDKDGYLTYRMRVNGQRKHVKAHRIVLNAFLGKNPEKQVNHKNGNKTDNSIENLEWATAAENNHHAIKTGLWKKTYGINQKIHPSNYVSIFLMIKECGFSRSDVANLNKVSRQTIDRIFNIVYRVLKNAEAKPYLKVLQGLD